MKSLKKGKKEEKSSIFSKGYEPIRKRVKKNPRFTMCCTNCKHYYQKEEDGDTEDMCQNPNVTKYDVVNDEGRVYCSYWEME